ncbi:methylated-DNA--[protein]-cysteine S-methyltransferase [Aequorivita vladivostokensis]|uniref:Methylated-DNA--protein-cysteine methyltransferase n=1 Tax=Aequorivita vladivostokensis TaxID=171194 RepID=A0ABR5DLK0_9FLAO|nr:methylated-DNA--[protein]-cysteine S-methyltransferase [Aequorivita vladivostokensis]KJJ39627.1 cysteine methyltransferase [Aequorivita vladivostokensis]
MMNRSYDDYVDTPIGILMLSFNEKFELVSAIFPEDEIALPVANGLGSVKIQRVKKQFEEYFNGTRKTFDIPLSPEGTEFQKKVWTELLNIPYGETTTYQQMANKLGDPKVIRAAASANGKNPISIVIPCHRVIGSDGSLTGYAGGLHRKKWLLELESPSPQQSLF